MEDITTWSAKESWLNLLLLIGSGVAGIGTQFMWDIASVGGKISLVLIVGSLLGICLWDTIIWRKMHQKGAILSGFYLLGVLVGWYVM